MLRNIKVAIVANLLLAITHNTGANNNSFQPVNNIGLKLHFSNSSITNMKKNLKAIEDPNLDSLNLSNSYFNPYMGGGIYSEVISKNYFGLRGEVLYTHQGGGVKNNKSGREQFYLKCYRHCLSIPTTFYFYPLGYNYYKGALSFHIGIQYDFVVAKKATMKFNDQEIKLSSGADPSNNPLPYFLASMDRVDIHIGGGVGFEFPYGLQIEGRYSYGLFGFFREEPNVAKNHSCYMSLGMGYNLCKIGKSR